MINTKRTLSDVLCLMPAMLMMVSIAINPRFVTLFRSALITGLAVALLAALLPIQIIVELFSIGYFATSMVVCIAIFLLRRRDPDRHHPFRMPCAWLIAPLTIGTVVYFIRGKRRQDQWCK